MPKYLSNKDTHTHTYVFTKHSKNESVIKVLDY